jgi:hypothetical protein
VSTFERSSGYCAIVVGIAGFLYSVAFVLNLRGIASLGGLVAFFLLVGAIMSVQALAAVYRRTREVDAGFALAALLFGFAGATAAALHGGYDLANVFHPPTSAPTDFPSPMDPRGLGTFGLAGLAILTFARLIQRGAVLPRPLATLGYVSGALLVLTYLGRLIVLDPNSPLILAPAAVEGLIVNPLWYVWLGLALIRGQRG